MADVFISHSSTDVAEARALREAIAGVGLTSWLAPDDVRDGLSWAAQIAAAVEQARVLVVLVSAASNASDHVAREVALAVRRRVPMLPVRLERLEVVGSLDYLLQLVQRLDAFPGGVRAHGAAIADRVRVLAESGPGARLDARPSSADGGVPARRAGRRQVTVLAVELSVVGPGDGAVDPETAGGVLTEIATRCSEVAARHGGVAELAALESPRLVFGVPAAHEDDALRAVRAARDIRAAIEHASAALKAERSLRIELRAGIATGEIMAGAGGSGQLTGEVPRDAARLAGAAGSGEILLAGATHRLVRDAVEVEPAGVDGSGPAETVRLRAVTDASTGHARRLDAPLVGRERELAGLQQAYREAVATRTCHLFTLLGPAGVGKSRLVAEFAESVVSEATVLKGRCLPYGDGITYWPLRDIVRQAAGIEEGATASEAVARLEAVVAGDRDGATVARRIASAIGISTEASSQEDIAWAARRLAEHLAKDRPLVLIVEDIHWAEPALLDLLERIADLARDAPLLLLCPARPEFLERRPSWGGGMLNARTVLLEALPPDAVARLLDALPGGNALPVDLRARVLGAAEGNPLFVEEMVEMLIEDGVLAEQDGAWHVAGDVGRVAVPPTVQALLAARLDQLAPAERAAAERASVVGRVFEAVAVSELTPESERPTLPAALVALVRKELVRPDRSELVAGDAFKFRHLLIRDAAYEALPKSERAELHEQFAAWLSATTAERALEYAEIIGYHLEQAWRYGSELGRPSADLAALGGRAGELLATAGDRAVRRGDASGAAELLRRAAALLPRDRRWVEAATARASAEFLRHDLDAAMAVIEDVIGVASALGDELLVARARIVQANVGLFRGDPTDLAVADPLIAIFERHHDARGLATAWAFRAALLGEAGDPGEAAAAQQALDHARLAGDAHVEGRAIQMLAANLLFGATPTSTAVVEVERLLDAAGGNLRVAAKVRSNLAALVAMRGEDEQARTIAAAGLAVLEELGLSLSLAMSRTLGAIYIDMTAERFTEAAAQLRACHDVAAALGASLNAASVAAALAQALAAGGELEEARRYADIAAETAVLADYDAQARWRQARATVLTRRGELAEAERLAREAVAVAAGTQDLSLQGDALEALGMVLAAAGRHEDARAARTDALERFERKEHLVAARRIRRSLEGA